MILSPLPPHAPPKKNYIDRFHSLVNRLKKKYHAQLYLPNKVLIEISFLCDAHLNKI